MKIGAWLGLLLVVGACSSNTEGGPGAGSEGGQGGEGGEGGTSTDAGSGGGEGGSGGDGSGPGGAGGAGLAGGGGSDPFPSGYQDDPWSVHLYLNQAAERHGNKLAMRIWHAPDYEGPVDDVEPPPAHAFYQTLTVELTLSQAVMDFICTEFTSDASQALVQPTSEDFESEVTIGSASLIQSLTGGGASNIVTICGDTLGRVIAPDFVMTTPVLPDIALMVPLDPDVQDFEVGTEFKAWVARGYLYVDEQAELSPQVDVKVLEVQDF